MPLRNTDTDLRKYGYTYAICFIYLLTCKRNNKIAAVFTNMLPIVTLKVRKLIQTLKK